MATRNRASTLSAALAEYCHLRAPAAGWDLVIVDNGSTDSTKQVVDRFRDRLPVTYCFEPVEGKNAALNAGLSLVTGDLVVFTDDDIFPKRDWLIELCAAAASHQAFSIFAGTIEPRWEQPPTETFLRMVPLGIHYSIHPAGMLEGPTRPEDAYGGNMAVRADVFRRGYRFDASIGPRPKRYTMGSEKEFVHRLARDGMTVWRCEHAIVEHLIPQAHTEVNWILERAVRWGRSKYYFQARDCFDPAPTWFGVPRWIYRAAVARAIAAAVAIAMGDRAELFRQRWQLRYLQGLAAEARSINREVGRGSVALPVQQPDLPA